MWPKVNEIWVWNALGVDDPVLVLDTYYDDKGLFTSAKVLDLITGHELVSWSIGHQLGGSLGRWYRVT